MSSPAVSGRPSARLLARGTGAFLAVTALVAGALALPPAASGAVSATAPVVISEVYGGGGNNGAPLSRDFVELANVGDTPVDLGAWSVQYASATGGSWQTTALEGVTLAAGSRLLVGMATGANTGLPGFDADVEGTTALSGTAGKVALVSSRTALVGATGQASNDAVVDYVGWGAAGDWAGSGAAPATTNATSVSRNAAAANTADNAADFAVGPPTPEGAGSTPDPDPEPEPEPALVATIAEIQGAGAESPLLGRTVTTEGVVTAHYPTGGLNGYVIQTAGTGAADSVSRTASDAVFVFSPAAVGEVALGDTVQVTGSVSEYYGLTQLTVGPGSASALPDAAAPVAVSTTWPASDAGRETLESMLVAPQGPFTVTDTYSTNQYGEVGLAAGEEPLRQPTDAARPGTPEAAAVADDNAARFVTLDDGASTNYLSAANSSSTPAYVSLVEPVIVGASATFTAPLIVDRRNDLWKLNPTTPVVGDGSGADGVVFENTRTAAPEDVGGDLSVASFNVLNYFTTLGTDSATCTAFADRTGDGLTVRGGCDQRGAWDAADLARQQSKIVSAIDALDADVVGLMEIENSAKLGETPDEATATLVAALNAAAGSEKWAFVPSSTELPDIALQDVITNAIIYQPAAAIPLGASRALGTQSGDDQAFGNAREPIAQVFLPAEGGEKTLFVVNHFKSKGSPGPWPGDVDAGDGQGASNESRVRQAGALRDWVPTVQADAPSVVLVGDFNSYTREDPLQVLYDAGFADAETALGIETSSYSFDGQSGSLDHILLNPAALDRATGGDIWNINSGESVALEYSRHNVHGTLFSVPDPYRSSDHDPVKVGLERGVDARAASRIQLVALPPIQLSRLLPATLVATVQVDGRPAADGTVEFREGDTVVGSAAVRRGTATLRLPDGSTRGIHRYTAAYVPADVGSVRESESRAVSVLVLR